MKVHELIEQLQDIDGDLEVVIAVVREDISEVVKLALDTEIVVEAHEDTGDMQAVINAMGEWQ